MFIAISFILLITAAVWLFNKFLPFKLCPICAGVSGTWLLLVFGIAAGLLSHAEYRPLVLLLMGATAAGVAYQGEKKFHFARQSVWRWKIPAVVVGLIVFWWLSLLVNWYTFILELALIAVLTYFFFIRRESRRTKLNHEISELKKKLDDCC